MSDELALFDLPAPTALVAGSVRRRAPPVGQRVLAPAPLKITPLLFMAVFPSIKDLNLTIAPGDVAIYPEVAWRAMRNRAAVRAGIARPMLARVTRALGWLADECPLMIRAQRLAGWVGQGRRVTPKGVLRPADVPAAAEALGVSIPARIRGR